uniref:Uncharacterized protein n=1 Tax=Coniferiporia sulphurascens TaxID=175648 RepID=A0A5B9RDC2_CONSH|nr:hypothetical protein PSUO_000057 [Coniferiporia sulphurascens]QEG57170.1 hypothetical protein PSUO_000057 [Coniferiporia sulphurascens]
MVRDIDLFYNTLPRAAAQRAPLHLTMYVPKGRDRVTCEAEQGTSCFLYLLAYLSLLALRYYFVFSLIYRYIYIYRKTVSDVLPLLFSCYNPQIHSTLGWGKGIAAW